MKPILVIDLETVVDPEMPAGRERSDKFIEYRATAAPSGLPDPPLLPKPPPVPTGAFFARDASNDFPVLSRWKIVSCGAFSFGAGLRVLGFGYDLPGLFDERLAIERLAELVADHTLVTFNGRRFDIPLIGLRALALGVPLATWYGQRGARYRYSDAAHLDVHDYLSDYGSAHVGTLGQVARLIGMPGKAPGEDGVSTAAMHAEGRFADIHRYCLSDVAQTAAIAIRVDYLRGELSGKEAREDATVLLEHIERRPELAGLLSGIDRKKFVEGIAS